MQIFLSHTGEDAFEADLLQLTLERWLADLNVKVWSYLRDQSTAERRVSGEILSQVRRSDAMLYLVSPATLDGSCTPATDWRKVAQSLREHLILSAPGNALKD